MLSHKYVANLCKTYLCFLYIILSNYDVSINEMFKFKVLRKAEFLTFACEKSHLAECGEFPRILNKKSDKFFPII